MRSGPSSTSSASIPSSSGPDRHPRRSPSEEHEVNSSAAALAVEPDDDAPAIAERGAKVKKRSYRRDTVTTTLWGLGAYALSLLTSPLLARALSADGRGSLAAVVRPTEILGWLLMFGVPMATAYLAIEADRRTLQASAWVFSLVVGIPVVAILWPFVPAFLDNHPPETVAWFRACLVAGLVILPFQNVYEQLRATGRTTRFNVYRSAPIVVNAVSVTALFFADRLTLNTALGASLAANLVVPLVVIGIERGFVVRMGRWFSWALMRRQLHYGARVWFGTLSNMVVARFDQLLMVRLVSASELGLYAIAATGAMVTAPIAQGVSFALFPYIRSEADPRRRWRRTQLAMRWVGLLSIGSGVVLGIVAPWGLPAVMGAEFRGAVTAFLLLLPGQVFWNLGQVVKVDLEATDRPGAASAALAVAAVLTLVTVPVAVEVAGISGAAAVTSACQVAFFLVAYWQARGGLSRPAPAPGPGGGGDDTPEEGTDELVGVEG
ncbi:MAG: oligosaccharide flippase family protein [Acidimicrobiia bacterium]|nr:oligosaccharide flippase family protein [Acidimicrobiia bacterium]